MQLEWNLAAGATPRPRFLEFPLADESAAPAAPARIQKRRLAA